MERINCYCCGEEAINELEHHDALDMDTESMSHCLMCDTYYCHSCARAAYGWPACQCGIDEVARDLVTTGHFDPLKNVGNE